jgi:hypothetical protein
MSQVNPKLAKKESAGLEYFISRRPAAGQGSL